MQVYIQNDRLSYAVSVPLVNKGGYKSYYLVPVQIPVNKDKLSTLEQPSLSCVWTKHSITSALTLNYKNSKNPLSKDTCVNRTNP
jgi:hypothetical protein